MADPDAAAGGRLQAAVVVRQGQLRAGRRGAGRADEHPQISVQRAGAGRCGAGVHPAARVPDRLELAEGVDQLGRVHPRQQLGPRLAVAVLAGQRSAVRDDQVGRVLDEPAEVGEPGLVTRSKSIRDVQAAVAEVAVVGAAAAVRVQQGVELAQVAPSCAGGTAASSQPGQASPPPGPRVSDARPVLADPPQRPHGRRVADDLVVRPSPSAISSAMASALAWASSRVAPPVST